jgi:hypothetical protein
VWSSTSASRLLGAAALALAALVASAPSAGAVSPRVQALVVGKSGWTVGPRTVAVSATRVNRCRVGAGLPIGVLRELRQPFRARGTCRALYVSQVRSDRERGPGGWVYKVGRSLPGRSASDPAGRLRSGQRVTWFWCRQAGNCARTLVTSARSSGGRMRVIVTGYDDFGRGRRVGAATVYVRMIGSRTRRTLRTGADGTVLVPVRAGRRYRIDSRRAGMVRGFPTTVRAR